MEEAGELKPRVCFEFQVEKVVGISVDGNYRVQWTPAWVSKFHLVGCEHLIEEYLQEQALKEIDCQDVSGSVRRCHEEVPDETVEREYSLIGMHYQNEVSEMTGNEPDSQHSLDSSSLTEIVVKVENIEDEADACTALEQYPQPETVSKNTSTDNVIEDAPIDPLVWSTPISIPEDNLPYSCPHCDFFCAEKVRLTAHMLTHSIEKEENIDSEVHTSTVVDEHPQSETTSKEEPTVPKLSTTPIHDRPYFRNRGDDSCAKKFQLKKYPLRYATEKAEKNIEKNKNNIDVKANTSTVVDEHPQLETPTKNDIDVVCNTSTTLDEYPQVQTTLKNIEKKFSCDLCSYSCSANKDLTKHLRIHTGEKPFRCDVCEKCFTNRGHLKQHKHLHTGYRPFSCDQCDYTCIQKNALITHVLKHTGERPFTCDICRKSFARKVNLQVHKRIHSDDRPFPCPQCSYSCRAKADLVKHLRTHSGKKPYSCDVCKKCFTTSSHLKLHKHVHTGVRPYACDQCDFTCVQKNNLKNHLMKHTGEKPFNCKSCEKSFSRKIDLQVHERTHTGDRPFSCPECTHTCQTKGDLAKHMQKHTGEKPFSCELCKKTFFQKGHLNAHARTHTGERPFVCDECGKTFTQKSNLNKHTKHFHT